MKQLPQIIRHGVGALNIWLGQISPFTPFTRHDCGQSSTVCDLFQASWKASLLDVCLGDDAPAKASKMKTLTVEGRYDPCGFSL